MEAFQQSGKISLNEWGGRRDLKQFESANVQSQMQLHSEAPATSLICAEFEIVECSLSSVSMSNTQTIDRVLEPFLSCKAETSDR